MNGNDLEIGDEKGGEKDNKDKWESAASMLYKYIFQATF